MPPRRHPARWAAIAAGITLLTAAILPGQAKTSSLAGTWKFNLEKTRELAGKRISDAPAFSREDGLRNSGANGRTTRNAGGGTPSSSGGGGSSGGRANLGPLGLYAQPLPELVIVQTDSSVTISDPRGDPRVYRLDGHKAVEPLLGADSLEIVAKWKDGKLTTERKLGSFGTVREVYSIDAAAHALIVDVKLSGPELAPPVELHWIYDAAPAG
jgi:hypothetical protein